LQIEEEKIAKALLDVVAKKKRLVGTDLIIDGMNQEQLLKMGVKVGLAHDDPEPGHLGAYKSAVEGVGSGSFLKMSQSQTHHVAPSTYMYYDGDVDGVGDGAREGQLNELHTVSADAMPPPRAMAGGPQTDLVMPFEHDDDDDYDDAHGNREDGVDRLSCIPTHEVKLKRVPTKGPYSTSSGQRVHPGGDDTGSISNLSVGASLSLVSQSQSQRSLTSLPSDYFKLLNHPSMKANCVTGAQPGVDVVSSSMPVSATSQMMVARLSGGGGGGGGGDEPAFSHPHEASALEMVPFDSSAVSVSLSPNPHASPSVKTVSSYLEERALAKLQSQERDRLLAGSFAPGNRPVPAPAPAPAPVHESGATMAECATNDMDVESIGGGSIASLGSLGSLTSMIRGDIGGPVGFGGGGGPNPQQMFRREQEHLFSDDVVYAEETVEDTPREFYHDNYQDSGPVIAEPDHEDDCPLHDVRLSVCLSVCLSDCLSVCSFVSKLCFMSTWCMLFHFTDVGRRSECTECIVP